MRKFLVGLAAIVGVFGFMATASASTVELSLSGTNHNNITQFYTVRDFITQTNQPFEITATVECNGNPNTTSDQYTVQIVRMNVANAPQPAQLPLAFNANVYSGSWTTDYVVPGYRDYKLLVTSVASGPGTCTWSYKVTVGL